MSKLESVIVQPEWWGKANDQRGVQYTEHAIDFIKQFPIGEKPISQQEFDSWLELRGFLTVPSGDDASNKNSDAWMAHIHRRHIFKQRLNKAASHPRLTRMGYSPFTIIAIRGGYEVTAPEVAASRGELSRKISSLTQTKHTQLTYLMQSADWDKLPAHERVFAQEIYTDINDFAADTTTRADRISQKVERLERRLSIAMSKGEIQPANGGIKQLLAPAKDDDDEE